MHYPLSHRRRSSSGTTRASVFDALTDPDTDYRRADCTRGPRSLGRGVWPQPREFATVKRLVAALRQMGFDYVFDTNFTADLTIMEEGSEFIERFTHASEHKWPMFTSCCPGWVRFVKSQFPEYVDSLSTAKSPQQMFGAVAKSYFAQKLGVDPHKICVISIMPCIAKKSECALPTMNDACGDPDVDIVLTTRELTRMMRSEHIIPEPTWMKPSLTAPWAPAPARPLSSAPPAALWTRPCAAPISCSPAQNPDAGRLHGRCAAWTAWKEAMLQYPRQPATVRVAVVSGLGNTRKLMQALRERRSSSTTLSRSWPVPAAAPAAAASPSTTAQSWLSSRGNVLWALDASDARPLLP